MDTIGSLTGRSEGVLDKVVYKLVQLRSLSLNQLRNILMVLKQLNRMLLDLLLLLDLLKDLLKQQYMGLWTQLLVPLPLLLL